MKPVAKPKQGKLNIMNKLKSKVKALEKSENTSKVYENSPNVNYENELPFTSELSQIQTSNNIILKDNPFLHNRQSSSSQNQSNTTPKSNDFDVQDIELINDETTQGAPKKKFNIMNKIRSRINRLEQSKSQDQTGLNDISKETKYVPPDSKEDLIARSKTPKVISRGKK